MRALFLFSNWSAHFQFISMHWLLLHRPASAVYDMSTVLLYTLYATCGEVLTHLSDTSLPARGAALQGLERQCQWGCDNCESVSTCISCLLISSLLYPHTLLMTCFLPAFSLCHHQVFFFFFFLKKWDQTKSEKENACLAFIWQPCILNSFKRGCKGKKARENRTCFTQFMQR